MSSIPIIFVCCLSVVRRALARGSAQVPMGGALGECAQVRDTEWPIRGVARGMIGHVCVDVCSGRCDVWMVELAPGRGSTSASHFCGPAVGSCGMCVSWIKEANKCLHEETAMRVVHAELHNQLAHEIRAHCPIPESDVPIKQEQESLCIIDPHLHLHCHLFSVNCTHISIQAICMFQRID